MKKAGSCRLGPKRALEVATKVRSWQRQGAAKRMTRAKLAAKLKISPSQLRTILKNPRKRVRVAAERIVVEAEAKKTATVFEMADAFTFPKKKSANTVINELEIKAISTRTVQTVRKTAKKAQRSHSALCKNQRGRAADLSRRRL